MRQYDYEIQLHFKKQLQVTSCRLQSRKQFQHFLVTCNLKLETANQ